VAGRVNSVEHPAGRGLRSGHRSLRKGVGVRKQISPNTTVARYAISWLKEFVDNDDRYEQFLCGAGAGTEATVDDYRTTCPLTN
jgi:hypothetical protein